MKRFLRPFIYLLFLSFLLSVSAGAQEPKSEPVSIRAEVDKAFITIGDIVTYRETIRRRKNVEILTKIPPPRDKVFEIRKVTDIHEEGKDFKISGREYQLTAFALGEYILEPVEISYRTGGGELQKASTNRLYITVESVAKGEEKQDIRDIKTVVTVPFRIPVWLWIILAMGFLILAAFVLKFILDKRKKLTEVFQPKLTPVDIALGDLRDLFESDLIRRGLVKQYFLRFSEIIRTFLESRYGVAAIEATTSELMWRLKSNGIAPEVRKPLQKLLEDSDLAKFAKWIPTPQEMTHLNKNAESLILICGNPTELDAQGEENNGV